MLFAILKKILINVTTNIENVNSVIYNMQRSMKRYYENKDKLSNQRTLFSEKN